MSGVSFYICIGPYGGFGMRRDCGIRVVLGWMCIALIFVDIEVMMGAVAKKIKESE